MFLKQAASKSQKSSAYNMGLGLPNILNVLKIITPPTVVYVLSYLVLTYPLVREFGTGLMASSEDALQNMWGLWWFKQALTNQSLELWYTNHLIAPHGVSLYTHALSPLNGALAFPLLHFTTLTKTYNILTLFHAVASGLVLFGFAFSLTKSYKASLLAGLWLTISPFRIGHSRGHIEMMAMEWLILFAWSYWNLLKVPTFKKAILAALLLRLALLNTPYHFLHGTIFAFFVTLVSFLLIKSKKRFIRQRLLPFLAFGIVTVITSFGFLLEINYINALGPLGNSHEPTDYSLDATSLLAPGKWWRLGETIRPFWEPITRSNEAIAYLGWSTMIFLTIVVISATRNKQSRLAITSLFVVLIGSTLIAMGPQLQIRGVSHEMLTPYDVASQLISAINMSGVPLRMMSLATIASSLLLAIAVAHLFKSRKSILVTLLAVVYVIEVLPAPLSPINIEPPAFVSVLAKQPPGIFFDTVNAPAVAMYHQTIHGQKLANSYLSRTPAAANLYQGKLNAAWEVRRDLSSLCHDFKVRYLLTNTLDTELTPLFSGNQTYLYDLDNCQGLSLL